jgi:hypothetical protein
MINLSARAFMKSSQPAFPPGHTQHGDLHVLPKGLNWPLAHLGLTAGHSAN